ncbi:hypothetical protein C0992_010312, partial [Termitomyces sp. T32_za158]
FESGSRGSGGNNRPNATASSSTERPIRQNDLFSVEIPETHLPEGWDAPLQNPMPRMVPLLPDPVHRGRPGNQAIVAHPTAAQPIVAQPAIIIPPETHLPEGWDAPLQNPVPRIVPPPPPLRRRYNRRNHGQEQALAVLEEQQQRLRDIAMAEAVLEEQRQLRHEEQRRQQALATLQQERIEVRQQQELDRLGQQVTQR